MATPANATTTNTTGQWYKLWGQKVIYFVVYIIFSLT